MRGILVLGVLVAPFGAPLLGCAVPTLDYASLDDAVASARCERFVTCGMFPDAATCAKFFGTPHDANVAAAIDAGRIAYHGEFAAQCVAALAGVSCDTTDNVARTTPQACVQMFEGRLATGATCNLDTECESRRCVLPPTAMCDEGACCPGTCGDRNLGATDDACARTVDCDAGNFCGADLVCHALGADGDTCMIDAECNVGLACSLGACRAPAAIGESCPFGRCADLGASCDATTTTCVAAGAPGDACTDSTQCSPFAECDGTVCAITPSLGQPCTGRCTADSYCDTAATQKCVAPEADGSPCEGNAQCTSHFCKVGAAFDSCAPAPICD